MLWTKPRILNELRRLQKSGADLSYNAIQKRRQPLLSAAAYHFGSYKRAIQHAGIEYLEVLRRPRWTRPAIITQIKKAKRAGKDLHWSAVTKNKNELARAAFASLQPRLFGGWDRALHAAGLHSDDISQYRAWDRNTILFELRELHRGGESVNSGAVQQDDPALHAAALRHFKGYGNALAAAGIDPDRVRQRKSWTKSLVIKALKKEQRRNAKLSDSLIRRQQPALHGAAVRLFGTFTAARAAAGVDHAASHRRRK